MKDFSISFAMPDAEGIVRSRTSKRWRNVTMDWSQLVRLCTTTLRTSETMDEYLAMKKSGDRDQKRRAADIKDVGGFFGGILDQTGLRQKSHVVSRTLLTLDIDDTANKLLTATRIWESFIKLYPDLAAVAYTTHSHTPQVPRMRMVIPLARPVSPEEYALLAQAVSMFIGCDLMDTTAFSPEHFMYWPSTTADGEFLHFTSDGAMLNPDPMIQLGRSIPESMWEKQPDSKPRKTPRLPSEHLAQEENCRIPPHAALAGLSGDELKFCQKYTIEEAIDSFLPTVYTGRRRGSGHGETARYSYVLADSADGLVCYDNFWARSFHNTDPACGRNLNAYQLVRLHLYSHLDKGHHSKRESNRPSVQAMRRLLCSVEQASVSEGKRWEEQIERLNNGTIRPTGENLDLIFSNDPGLAGKIRYDIFNECIRCTGQVPWRDSRGKSSYWTDMDDCCLRGYLDKNYGLRNCQHMIYDAVSRYAELCKYHPIQEYLEGLPEWDGTPRVETLLCDHLGAKDTPLTRRMTRKWLVAAVKRIYEPGCKFDYCLVLKGEQGVGKSSVFEVLAGDYHNGSINQIEGRDGREGLLGSWIVEFSELSALRRSEVETIKAFITDRSDRYRPAYGRRCTDHPRQCVFCATTNSESFLKDDTGNRRFWVVAVDPRRMGTTAERISRLKAERDQIWAEAYRIYLHGEPLYLDGEMEEQLKDVQSEFYDSDDDLADRLDTYLETPIPLRWHNMSMADRRLYYSSPTWAGSYKDHQDRRHFTAREFYCEMLLGSPDRIDLGLCRRLKRLMRARQGWTEVSQPTISTGWAGRQRGFVKED